MFNNGSVLKMRNFKYFWGHVLYKVSRCRVSPQSVRYPNAFYVAATLAFEKEVKVMRPVL